MKRELKITVTVEGAQCEGKTTLLRYMRNWLFGAPIAQRKVKFDEVFVEDIENQPTSETKQFIVRWEDTPTCQPKPSNTTTSDSATPTL